MSLKTSKDLIALIKLANLAQDNISIDYDNLTNKIYLTNTDTGEVKDIDMIKYKINKEYEQYIDKSE